MEEELRVVVVVTRQEVVLRDDASAAVEIAAAPAADESTEDGDARSEFEFPLVGSRVSSPALADDLFADGRIRPIYPVFGRGADHCLDPAPAAAAEPEQRKTRGQLGRLFMEETRAWHSLSLSSGSTSSSSSSSSSADLDDGGLEGLPPESYCVWAPGGPSSSSAAAGGSSPRPRPRKSASMGSSMARWRRISDLVVGRSHSDGGKAKLLFLPTPPPPPTPKPKPKPSPAGKKKAADHPAATEIGTVAAARRMAYYGAAKQQQGGVPRRTFLPYREELVGFFANVNGISRSPHPY